MAAKKKTRCTCSNCGRVKYLPTSSIDLGEEHFLCDTCDSAYVTWQNAVSDQSRIYVDDFLRSTAAKRCKAR